MYKIDQVFTDNAFDDFPPFLLNQVRGKENYVDTNTFGWIHRMILADFHIELNSCSLLQTIFQASGGKQGVRSVFRAIS